jgi:Cytochrome P460
MITTAKIALVVAALLAPVARFLGDIESPDEPQYTDDVQLKFPAHYREWVYLTTGFDMSYTASSGMADHHMFDNVFVNPEAYKVFVATGHWPDKTMLVLEQRGARSKGSINQKGNYQNEEVMGIEVHVRDDARFPGKWVFFGFDGGRTGKMRAQTENCYSCHQDHGAVDTTFVQFYPTLMPIAKIKNTLAAKYLQELAMPEAKQPL